MKRPNVRKLASMMRLGKKYQLDDIFQEALTRLKDQFPQTHDAYDSISNAFCDWIVTYFEDIVCFGEEMALWSILPITYYIAASDEESIVSHIIIVVNTSSAEYISITDTGEIPPLLSKSPI